MSGRDTMYPGRWGSLLFALRGKVPAHAGNWLDEGLERYESGEQATIEPGLNVGLVVPPGLLVLDCDSAEAVAFVAEWLPDDAYPMVISQPGRAHFYVRLADPSVFDTQASGDSPGGKVDFRLGGHGYCAAPPSIHPATGLPYELRVPFPADPDDVPTIDLDRCKQLLEWQAARKKHASEPTQPGAAPVTDWDTAAGGAIQIVEGGRNEHLYRLGCAMADRVGSASELLASLRVRNAEDCPIPLLDSEVQRIAYSCRQHIAPPHQRDATGAIEVGRFYSDIEPRPIDWLWIYHIPVGQMVMLDGDGGIGKSLLALDLAARVSAGGCWPDGTPCGEPAGVVIASGEEDPHQMISPKLIAAGADRSKILELSAPFESLADTDVLRAAVVKAKARLVILDPVMDYLEVKDAHKDNEIRRAVRAVRALAQELGFALLCVRHLSKGAAAGSAAHAGLGSVSWTNQARAVFLVARNPDRPGYGRFGISKTNLAPPEMLQQMREFQVLSSGDAFEPELRVEWAPETVAMTADEALQLSRGNVEQDLDGSTMAKARKKRASPKRDAACAWIRQALAAGGRPRSALRKEAEAAGYNKTTFFDAMDKLEETGLEEYRDEGETYVRVPRDN